MRALARAGLVVTVDGAVRRHTKPYVARRGIVEAADRRVHQEEDEELVVVGAYTVVDECAVMIHAPNTAAALTVH